MRRRFVQSLALATLLCVQALAAAEFQPAQLKGFPRGTLTIERADGRDSFSIWIADTDARQQQGLMWLRKMPADCGMLFPLSPPRQMNMWMKNTYLPLDMLFFGADGRVVQIVRNAKPLSEEILPSEGVVAGVLEILGGEAERRGVRLGDRLAFTSQR